MGEAERTNKGRRCKQSGEGNKGSVGLSFIERIIKDFPGGAVVKNPPTNAGDTGSIPGPGRPHMPRSS